MEVVTTGVDMLAVKKVLDEIKKHRLFQSQVTKAGRARKYAYLNIPRIIVDLLKLRGTRFSVVIGEGYVDYVVDPSGDYLASSYGVNRGGAKIRFPLDYEGPVFIELRPRGFRVYY